jgi:hypothetical protein
MTIKKKYHFPRIDDLFGHLRGVVVFSKIDLRSGYHQVRIKSEDIHMISFMKRYENYHFVVVPFELINAPSTFMFLMNSVLNKYLDKFVLVFLDEILVYSKNSEENEEHLRMVLQLLREHQLYANINKYNLFQEEIWYLGHVIATKGVIVDSEKIKEIMDWTIPRNMKKVRSFTGLDGYYMMFIKGFSNIGNPINSLLRKGKRFIWSPKCEDSFKHLKHLLTNSLVLKIAYPENDFLVCIDACKERLGEFIMKEGKMILYESGKLNEHETNNVTHDLELVEIVHVLKMWRH